MIIKMGTFQNILIMEILSRVCHLCHFITILSNGHEISRISFFVGTYYIYLPFVRFRIENPCSTMFLNKLFFLSTDFQTFAAHFATK